jgi:hypothetical protein
MQKYTKTIQVSSFADIPATTKAGQWVQQADGVKGQYLGTTKAGTQVMHYNTSKHPQIIRNAVTRELRSFAVKFAR